MTVRLWQRYDLPYQRSGIKVLDAWLLLDSWVLNRLHLKRNHIVSKRTYYFRRRVERYDSTKELYCLNRPMLLEVSVLEKRLRDVEAKSGSQGLGDQRD